MKNKLYYILFPLYAAVVVFVLYINGLFTGQVTSMSNLLINGAFMVVIGVIFLISASGFGRLNRCTDELTAAAEKMQKEYRDAGGKNVWMNYQDNKNMFAEGILNDAFQKYRLRIRGYRTRRGYSASCDLGEYINEDLMDTAGRTYFNSGIPGTLTGLGILGTFLGLAIGLGSFSGDDIFTISDNVGPLLAGMKVAFHTSVYGIFFSLVFNFVYRSIMADAYDKLESFLDVFRQCAQPVAASEDENSAVMLVYQANMANYLKQMLDLMKGTEKEQTEGVKRIVDQFTEQMSAALGVNFEKLGVSLREAAQVQNTYAQQCESLTEAVAGMVEINRETQKNLDLLVQRQEEFAKELLEQKQKLEAACSQITDEVSSQLYTFEQMRSLYGKQ